MEERLEEMHFGVVAQWVSITLWAVSTVLWFIASSVEPPTLTGMLSDLAPEKLGKLSKIMTTQSSRNSWAAVVSALAALASALVLLSD